VYRDEEGVKEKQLLALEDGCMRERRRKVKEFKKVENIGSINGGTVAPPAINYECLWAVCVKEMLIS